MIVVAMQDLAEVDWKELEKELEEKMAERRQRKLAFFQKTCNGVVRKAYTAPASGVKVNTSLSPEDLVHMVEVSVASKYGADLIQFTRVVAEDMRSMLDPFKQDLSGSLPRQVRAIVQQLSGESHEKRTEEFVATPNQGSTSNPRNRGGGVLANVSQGNTGANLNLQQPYYQTMAYGPSMQPSGNGIPHGPVPDILFPRTLAPHTPNTWLTAAHRWRASGSF
jgi:hypothetical protein